MKEETKAVLEKYNIEIKYGYISNWVEECKENHKFLLQGKYYKSKYSNINFTNEIIDLLERYSLINYFEIFDYLAYHIFEYMEHPLYGIIEEYTIDEYKEDQELKKFKQVIEELKPNDYNLSWYEPDNFIDAKNIRLTISYDTKKGTKKATVIDNNTFFREIFNFIKKYDKKTILFENEKRDNKNFKDIPESESLESKEFFKKIRDRDEEEKNRIINSHLKKGRKNKNYIIYRTLNALYKILQNETSLKSETKTISQDQGEFIYDFLVICNLIKKKEVTEISKMDKANYIRSTKLNYQKTNDIK